MSKPRLKQLASRLEPPAAPMCLGEIVGIAESGLPLVVVDGSSECVETLTSVPVLASDLGRRAVLAFVGVEANFDVDVSGDREGADESRRPVVMGLLWQPPRLHSGSEPGVGKGHPVELVVDGKRLELRATESLALRCGPACIELRADGRLTLSGEDVLSRAVHTQRLVGGHVKIN